MSLRFWFYSSCMSAGGCHNNIHSSTQKSLSALVIKTEVNLNVYVDVRKLSFNLKLIKVNYLQKAILDG